MKLFIKILLSVFIVLIANVNATSATITFPNIQEATASFSFRNEIPKMVFKVFENDLSNCCQNRADLIAYRNWGTSVEARAAKGGLQYSDDLLRAAQQAYPKLAGKTHLHHITPKYLGGPANGPLIKLDAAYHQQITNEFRKYWSYGQGTIKDPVLRQQIMDKVYSVFPLPK